MMPGLPSLAIASPLIALGMLAGLTGLAGPGEQPVRAQNAEGLRVQVVNGTPGGGTVAGLPLTVYSLDGDQEQVAAQGRTDERGAFAWPGLVGAVSARYVVSTTYAGVAYTSEPVSLPAAEVSLRVYETTGDDAAIRVASAGLVVLAVDAANQRIRLLESVTLQNGGDRTFVPSTTGPRGPMGLLRFGLPDGAGNLAPDGLLASSAIIQVNSGFASDLPVPPGTRDVSYTYEIAYGVLSEQGHAQISKTLPYATDLLRVLVAEGDFEVESPQLDPLGVVTVGARSYRQYEARDLPARSEISLELRGLPLVLPVLRPGNPWLRLAVGASLLLAVAFPLMHARRYRYRARARGAALPEPSAMEQPGAGRLRRVTSRPPVERGYKG